MIFDRGMIGYDAKRDVSIHKSTGTPMVALLIRSKPPKRTYDKMKQIYPSVTKTRGGGGYLLVEESFPSMISEIDDRSPHNS